MKTIIAGGRNYELTEADLAELNNLWKDLPITEVVSGGASGADAGGEVWAAIRKVKMTRFYAPWGEHGKQAGPMRNARMARYADALIAFPGGQGTANMVMLAKRAGLAVFDWREIGRVSGDTGTV